MQNTGQETEHLQRSLQASGLGTWHFNSTTGTMFLDENAQQLFGFNKPDASYSSVFALAEPHYTDYVAHELGNALTTGSIKMHYTTAGNNYIAVKGNRYNGTDVFYGTVAPAQPLENNSVIDVTTLQSIIQESNIGMGLYVGRELRIGIANRVMLNFWGKGNIVGQLLETAIPELEGQPFIEILTSIFTTGEVYQVTEHPVDLAVNGIFGTYYFDFMYKPLFNQSGQVYAILNTAVEVTDRVVSKRRLQESESLFRAVTEQSPMAIGLLKGDDMVVELGNSKIFEVWGKDKSIIGMPIQEALPEIKGQVFPELLKKVYTTGISYQGYDILAKLVHNGVLTDVYFDFTYSALRDENEVIYGVLILATDVTDRVLTIRKIAESEAKFKAVIYSAQAAMAVFKGRDELVVDIANDAFLKFVGRPPEQFIGLPLLESMPEMLGQASIGLMQEVFDTGIKMHHYGRQVNIVRDGELTKNYYNVSYTPLFDATGAVYAVLDIAIDVTETIKIQQAILEAEASLRGAIELADLATWTLDPITLKLTYSEKLLDWFGIKDTEEELHFVIDALHIRDRERVQQSLYNALQPESNGIYEEEYTVINRITGRERILHAQGKTFFDAKGKPYIMRGTAQDITSQKKLQQTLEDEVRERTEALKTANKELEDMNVRLKNSNEELAQYAYVASHDLQEPLRKISMFSNLLKEKDSDNVHAATIDKIVRSSERMSLLIKDLLEFSRLLSPDTRFVRTNLNDIVRAVKSDFELLIEEKGAHIEIENLPIIEAVPLQMNQLFYNLIGNALKFVQAGVVPKITINCTKLDDNEVSEHVSHPVDVNYYCFTIADNGIGIDEQYKKQIFEVFKRLHARTEYSGSGIGLAICRRIVVNHGGAIYIKSALGKGTTFHIVLPEMQMAGHKDNFLN